MANCAFCGAQIIEGKMSCSRCGVRVDAKLPPRPAETAYLGIWYQNFYRIHKKVLAIANQYWIEDAKGTQLGFSRQKILRIKESIRVFKDDNMTMEIFRIQQEQLVDMWGTFAVIDSVTGACVGKFRRKAVKSGVYKSEYLLQDPNGMDIGRVAERGGRGLVRRYVPFGSMVPEQMVVEFNGQTVAEIKQQFKVIGDIWEVDCSHIPVNFDRRVLLSAMLLMGMIERGRK